MADSMKRDLFFKNMETEDHLCKKATLPLINGRGFSVSTYSVPGDFPKRLNIEGADQTEQFFRILKRYSARLLLHDLLIHPEGAELKELTNYCSEKSARRILRAFEKTGAIRTVVNQFKPELKSNMRIGDVIEWFITVTLAKIFQAPAISNVSVRGGYAGGDYDVLANWMGKLVFIEVKSAPPKGIHNPEIAAFLQRVFDLLPDIAIFFDDTHLRVKDKIVLMFEEELIHLRGIKSLKDVPIERVSGQIFHLAHYLYIMNSKRDIGRNLTTVFRDYLRYRLPVHRFGL